MNREQIKSFAVTLAICGLCRGARSDIGIGVPSGTLASLVPLGFATVRGDGRLRPTDKARALFADWLAAGSRQGEPIPLPASERTRTGRKAVDRRLIRIIAKSEPKFVPGSQREGHWRMLVNSPHLMTVENFLAAGGIKISLLVFEQRKLITYE